MKRILQGALGAGSSFAKGVFSFGSLKSYKSTFKSLGNSKDLLGIGKASANLLGKSSGLVMAGRLLQGRSPLRDKRGKANVPMVPFV